MTTIKQIIEAFLKERDENVTPDEADETERQRERSGSAEELIILIGLNSRKPAGWLHYSGAMISSEVIGNAINVSGWERVFTETALEIVLTETTIDAAVFSALKCIAASVGEPVPEDPDFIELHKKSDPEDYQGMSELVNAVLVGAMGAKRAGGGLPWRCFQCNEVFDLEEDAAAHFGVHEFCEPACKIDAAKYREMEREVERSRAEDSDTDRRMYAMQGDHRAALINEEQKGYDRGLRDGRAANVEAFKLIRKAIMEAANFDVAVITDTLWMPNEKPNQTVIDFIDMEIQAITGEVPPREDVEGEGA